MTINSKSNNSNSRIIIVTADVALRISRVQEYTRVTSGKRWNRNERYFTLVHTLNITIKKLIIWQRDLLTKACNADEGQEANAEDEAADDVSATSASQSECVKLLILFANWTIYSNQFQSNLSRPKYKPVCNGPFKWWIEFLRFA